MQARPLVGELPHAERRIRRHGRFASQAAQDSDPENGKLKNLLVGTVRENEVTREALQIRALTAPARREVVRSMQARGLTESGRHAFACHECALAALPASARPQRGTAGAHLCPPQRHRRYGVGMIHWKLLEAQ